MDKDKVLVISRKYINLLKAEGISVEKAFLFGSHLTNTATNESDIDLMIVTEKDTDDQLSGKIWNLTKKVNSRIEPFIVSSNQFNCDNSLLIDLVKKTGLEIA